MPKLKTKSSAKKRFRCTGSGSIVHGPAHKRHLLRKKSSSMKRKAIGSLSLHSSSIKLVSRYFLPYL